MSKQRLEAFSDGVFAIVITLLILEVHLPTEGELTWAVLAQALPHVLAFILSFVLVGTYWIAHHNMWGFVGKVDRYLLWLNLVLLLTVVFIPFPAALLGSHLTDPIAVTLYGLSLALVNAAGTCVWLYAMKRDLRVRGVPDRFVRFVAIIHSAPIAVYLLGIALASAHVAGSLVLYAAVPIFFILPNPLIDREIAAALAAIERTGRRPGD
jgi:uncharacterized membrane protein